MVKLGELSIFRTELMGISALLILICHLYGYVDLSVTVQYILSLGNIGVDCFLFLSGVGMWNSLLKRALDEKAKNSNRPASHFMIDPIRKNI